MSAPLIAALVALAYVGVIALAGWLASKADDKWGHGASTLTFLAVMAPAVAAGLVALVGSAGCGP